MDSQLSVSALVSGVWSALADNTVPAVTFVIAITASSVVIDLTIGEAPGASLVNGLVGLIAGYLLLRAVLLSVGLADRDSVAGFGAYFGFGLVQGLALVVGFVLLVIPGIVLMVRWIPSSALLLCEGEGINESLRQSWDRTKGHFWPLFGAMLLGLVPIFFVAVAGSVITGLAGGPDNALTTQLNAGLTNLVVSTWSVYSCLLTVTAYKLLFRRHSDVAEVFA